MIVQNISKWTTREISKMLMEIQGTDPSKQFGSGKNIWRLFSGWSVVTICNAARVVLFLCLGEIVGAKKHSIIMISGFQPKLAAGNRCTYVYSLRLPLKNPLCQNVRRFVFSYPRPTFELISFQFIFLINSSEERSVEFYNW